MGAATTSQTTSVAAPGPLPSGAALVRVDVAAIDPARTEWTRPVTVFFRRMTGGYKLVGVERQP
jgi:hypothetical protein